ncbi:peptide antibiotic transporter SbmA [Youhaiella tibetensis]|uniref:Peptide antibiotic transporter SbmA n=1 Tax=Paradevosia tibetensis TaxID=1447062 RepID=A0A5B9DRX1_9HYPH|nr:peptide antibiotic transporter SbmA [Youhaiella tibetensis]AKR56155.1 microcin B17 transporter [Devosia sp. H5989]QEE21208.1 peptide antibiotic transporter SbmA [Youhaiella tibetensis]GGF16982.1 peptide antibiotic transporter SbmA [Youhaiella tibetensis]
MFRSFFPVPKIFFTSAIVWLLVAVLAWFAIGEQLRAVISIDHLVTPTVCAGAAPEEPSGARSPEAPAITPAAPVDGTAAQPNCVAEDNNFLNGDKIWLYEYVLLISVLFCVFWYFYKRNEWYWWSVVGSTGILLVIYFNVQIDAWVNDWQGTFFNLLQKALSQPGSVSPTEFYAQIFVIFAVLLPNILVLVLLAFFTSHYVFRWRKAMNAYYMSYWQTIRTVEGAAQRVQEDTMRFASIVEDLGTSFFSSLITLVVFLPILWTLSQHVTELPFFGDIPGSLVWVALVAAAAGTVLLALVGIKLPGLQFENQKVEAAYRKELVYGEDSAERAQPPTVRDLFAHVQKNYFRLYFHYTYFNLARYGYLQAAGYIPLLALSPSILAGTLTLGLYQQVQQAFGQVSVSFQFFARAWTTIVELQSIHKRLRLFESFIPVGQEAVREPEQVVA